MRVFPVDNPQLLKAYVDVPWSIYCSDPHWVPPLKSEFRKYMSPRHNPFFRQAEIEHFVALANNGDTLGRISATVYPAHNQRYETRTGFFGFFEAVKDSKVAQALLGAAEAWVRERGMERIAGPYNYSSTQEMGLLVEGFDIPPALFQTYNPSYYPDLLQAFGYRQEFSMQTFAIAVDSILAAAPAFLPTNHAVAAKEQLSARRINMRRFRQETEILRALFNASFAANDAVLPIAKEMFEFQAQSLKPFLDPRLISIIEKQGQPVAFTLVVPNLNELLVRFNGSAPFWALLTYRRLLRQIRSVVVLAIGALPELHGAGLGRSLVAEIIRSLAESNYELIHTTWIHEQNWMIRVLAQSVAVHHRKCFAVYGRTF